MCLYTCRFSGLINVEDLCYLTFEPDQLTLPDTPPLNLTHYTLYYTPVNRESKAVNIHYV